ncbi:MAG: tetratricopeptide repeat protein [Woeseiaceae bacterium]
MESPLVKALSHAGDDDAASKPHAEQISETADVPQHPAPDELQLMDSTQALVVDDETGEVTQESAEEPADEATGEFAETATVTTDQSANEDADIVARDISHVSATAANTTASSRLWIRRVGSYTPIVCIIFAAATSACYFAYQKLGGSNQNTDLQALSNQSRPISSTTDDAGTGVETNQNPFKLSVGSRRSSSRLSSSPKSSPPKPSPAATLNDGSDAVRSAPVDQPRPVAVTVTDASIDDNAYASLKEAFSAYERGDYEQSEMAYRRALSIAPRHPNALQGLAAILHRSDRFDESRQFYESLLSVDPGNTAAAAALLTGGDETTRVANESDIKQLIQRHPNSAGLQFALGQLMARQSRWADARDLFVTAVRLDGDNADYLFNLAISLEHLGLYGDARESYEAALASASAASALNSEIAIARIESISAQLTAENEAQ